jgi:hypothetical protein
MHELYKLECVAREGYETYNFLKGGSKCMSLCSNAE